MCERDLYTCVGVGGGGSVCVYLFLTAGAYNVFILYDFVYMWGGGGGGSVCVYLFLDCRCV